MQGSTNESFKGSSIPKNTSSVHNNNISQNDNTVNNSNMQNISNNTSNDIANKNGLANLERLSLKMPINTLNNTEHTKLMLSSIHGSQQLKRDVNPIENNKNLVYNENKGDEYGKSQNNERGLGRIYSGAGIEQSAVAENVGKTRFGASEYSSFEQTAKSTKSTGLTTEKNKYVG